MMTHSFLGADEEDRKKWDARYGGEEFIFGKQPVASLKENIHLLPKGKALDIAMGEGRNGVASGIGNSHWEERKSGGFIGAIQGLENRFAQHP